MPKMRPATVAVHDVGNLEAMKKYGTVTIDNKGVITNFEEKPKEPKSTLAAVALYYYSRDHLGSIREMTDSTGGLVARYDYDPWGKSVVVSGNMQPGD